MSVDVREPLYIPDEEIKLVFIKTLTELYEMKAELMSYLPLMASKANVNALKTSILQFSIEIQDHLFRLDIIMGLLNAECNTAKQVEPTELNLQNYLKSSMNLTTPFKADCSMLIHLILFESSEIASLRLLLKMSHQLQPKYINNMLSASLSEAYANKKHLADLLESYLSWLIFEKTKD